MTTVTRSPWQPSTPADGLVPSRLGRAEHHEHPYACGNPASCAPLSSNSRAVGTARRAGQAGSRAGRPGAGQMPSRANAPPTTGPDYGNRRLNGKQCNAGSAARACHLGELPATLIGLGGEATPTLAAETA